MWNFKRIFFMKKQKGVGLILKQGVLVSFRFFIMNENRSSDLSAF